MGDVLRSRAYCAFQQPVDGLSRNNIPPSCDTFFVISLDVSDNDSPQRGEIPLVDRYHDGIRGSTDCTISATSRSHARLVA